MRAGVLPRRDGISFDFQPPLLLCRQRRRQERFRPRTAAMSFHARASVANA